MHQRERVDSMCFHNNTNIPLFTSAAKLHSLLLSLDRFLFKAVKLRLQQLTSCSL